ncbi:hypothetical protein U879_09975 [Defluviimonas sp. 20V17]|uniref:Uncharacterized protein n=1 Tax=Allgaiera indica TaxID=765699 RepID=A0AAN4UPW6_9RHOB|nr:DUF5333 domain-containing protein [Allgaiera indica]KDB03877.1 hypothetical protein U879_09975 [Defluviimonas sp. 20V17]GHE00094.1 hypothetical protein GCM10008024_10430 [Allgaiera indica]SDW37321.1 hypothetical protein SAMN05444006_10348 [Allgaiera indica]
MTQSLKPLALGMMLATLPAAAFGPVAAATAPAVPLVRNAHVMDQLVAARTADVIRHQCPTISGRLIKAFFKAEELKAYALNHGYSADQIRAFLKDPKARKLVESRADARLAKLGAKAGDAQSYCKAGKAEIASGSLAGSLLYAR